MPALWRIVNTKSHQSLPLICWGLSQRNLCGLANVYAAVGSVRGIATQWQRPFPLYCINWQRNHYYSASSFTMLLKTLYHGYVARLNISSKCYPSLPQCLPCRLPYRLPCMVYLFLADIFPPELRLKEGGGVPPP